MSGVSTYGSAIRDAHVHLLSSYPDVLVVGQGLWSPWYVGNTMTNLEDMFGTGRLIDTPVSEAACTGVAIGAALRGNRSIAVHPRVDFALLAVDQIVNQAAKWSSMFGGRARVPVTFRCIINRGGEQGAQHSQSLFSWFAHVPGLRVVMPYSVADARELFISSVLCPDPVMFFDDRWLYDDQASLGPVEELDLREIGPALLRFGTDITLVGASYSTKLCIGAAQELETIGISADVIDLRVINPLCTRLIIESVEKTGRLLVVDGDWRPCGLAAEIVASVAEATGAATWKAAPRRVTLPFAPAPTSKPLEDRYYIRISDVVSVVRSMLS